MEAVGCTYRELEQGIHEIHLHETTPAAVDEWMKIIDRLYAETAHDDLLRILLIFPGMVPIGSTTQKVREVLQKHPQRARRRTAFLYKPNPLMSVVTTLVGSFSSRSRDAAKFFPIDKRDEALQWLLSEG